MNPTEFLFETLSVRGEARYGMEKLNQLEHALQCATLAEQESSDPSLIVAALFHDLGHLIDIPAPDMARQMDDRHETKGAAMLSKWFSDDVVEPIKLHVPAKRYLCAVEADYLDGLSQASKHSLELQGKPFDKKGVEDFIRQPFAAESVLIRRWDDQAKVPGLNVPRLDHYRPIVEELLKCNAPRSREAV